MVGWPGAQINLSVKSAIRLPANDCLERDIAELQSKTWKLGHSITVVLSLSTVIFLAWPRSAIWTFSSLMPRSSVMALPPVVAMSCSMALRRSPKPGALTAQTCSVPRSLLTTRVASAFALDVLSEQRIAALGDLLQQREHILHGSDFLFVDESRTPLTCGNI